MALRFRLNWPSYSCQYFFTLGLFVGILGGFVTTLQRINPLSRIIVTQVSKWNEVEESLKIQKALSMAVNYQLRTESTVPRDLLQRAEEDLAKLIAQNANILCMVMMNATQREAALHVKRTWGRHCSSLIFMSDESDKLLPSVKVTGEGNKNSSWSKTVNAFKHAYKNHRFDWLLKVDATNFVFVEDLQEMLLPHPPNKPSFFGFRLKPVLPQGYMSENAGTVLSTDSVKRLVKLGFDGKSNDCPEAQNNKQPDDVNLALCLAAVGAEAGDSRDWEGRHRFFPLDVATHTVAWPTKLKWFWAYTYWPVFLGIEGCSDKPVSFHYIKPTAMYMFEYLAYYVRPFIVNSLEINTPAPTIMPPPNATSSSTSSTAN